MAPPVVLKNFKFKYFFGVQIPTKKSHPPPLANLVSCNVPKSNNTNEQRNFLQALELQFSLLEIFDVNPNAMFKIDVINVDDECVPLPKILKRLLLTSIVNFKSFGL
jgi:hypothetical protein